MRKYANTNAHTCHRAWHACTCWSLLPVRRRSVDGRVLNRQSSTGSANCLYISAVLLTALQSCLQLFTARKRSKPCLTRPVTTYRLFLFEFKFWLRSCPHCSPLHSAPSRNDTPCLLPYSSTSSFSTALAYSFISFAFIMPLWRRHPLTCSVLTTLRLFLLSKKHSYSLYCFLPALLILFFAVIEALVISSQNQSLSLPHTTLLFHPHFLHRGFMEHFASFPSHFNLSGDPHRQQPWHFLQHMRNKKSYSVTECNCNSSCVGSHRFNVPCFSSRSL